MLFLFSFAILKCNNKNSTVLFHLLSSVVNTLPQFALSFAEPFSMWGVYVCVCVREREREFFSEQFENKLHSCAPKSKGYFCTLPWHHYQHQFYSDIFYVVYLCSSFDGWPNDVFCSILPHLHLIHYRIQSRSDNTFSCHDLRAFFNVKHFPQSLSFMTFIFWKILSFNRICFSFCIRSAFPQD